MSESGYVMQVGTGFIEEAIREKVSREIPGRAAGEVILSHRRRRSAPTEFGARITIVEQVESAKPPPIVARPKS